MTHIHILKTIAIYLFKLIIKETEQRFSYLFALFVFSGVFVLALLDKNLQVVSAVGAFCLFLLKLPEIILCLKGEQKVTLHFDTQSLKKTVKERTPLKEENVLQVLQKVSETLPDKLLLFLEKKYALSKEEVQKISEILHSKNIDAFLFQTQLEAYGLPEESAEVLVKLCISFRAVSSFIKKR